MVVAWFALGTIGLILLLLAGRGFVNADPRVLAQGLRIGGAVVCGGLALFFLVRAQFYFAMVCGAAAAGSLGWWPRGLSLFGFRFGPFGGGNTAGWSRARTAPPNGGPSSSGAASGSGNARSQGGAQNKAGTGQSQVETDWLRMTLDRATGGMDGEVLRGRWIGRRLSELNFRDLVALLRRCDAQSAALLEAWLDRTQAADWREQAAALAAEEAAAGEAGGRAGATSGAGMTREQAWDVLGLPPGSSPEAIRAAHRRLMKLAHPDQGGSTWLAAQVNRAKDVLLGP